MDPVLKKTIAYRIAITVILFVYVVIYLVLTKKISLQKAMPLAYNVGIGTLIISTTFYYFFEKYWST